MKRLKAMKPERGQPDNLPDDPGFLQRVYSSIRPNLDFSHGGTRGAPKFPMPSHLMFLLRYSQLVQDGEVAGYVPPHWKRWHTEEVTISLEVGFPALP